MDKLTLTIRLHDPAEKKKAENSTAWKVIDVPREDLKLSPDEFAAKFILPALPSLLALGTAKQAVAVSAVPAVQNQTPTIASGSDTNQGN